MMETNAAEEGMVERAAASLWLWSEMRREPVPEHRIAWGDVPEHRRRYLRLEALAALCAALDPEDEVLVDAVTGVLSQYDDAMITTADHPGAARAVIALLGRATA